MTRFVSIGECMVEMAPLAQAGQFQMSFAGDTLNTAWYARRLRPDWDVRYVTAVGQDQLSDQLVGFLKDAGIAADHVRRDPVRTIGLYLIALQNGERHFSYWRGQAAARRLTADLAALDRALEGDLIYFSGITLAVQEGDGRALLLDALARARHRGHRIAFDSNLRPRLWEDKRTMCDWVSKAARISDIILPSHDDEATFFGDTSPEATRDRYLAAGAGTVVVKNGQGPIVFAHQGQTGTVMPTPVSNVVDTTAAGDSFNAGFLTSCDADADLTESIRVGCRVAGAVIKGRGALLEIGSVSNAS